MTSGFIIMALQTAFNTKQLQQWINTKKTVQSIRLFWAQEYNRIIVDYEKGWLAIAKLKPLSLFISLF